MKAPQFQPTASSRAGRSAPLDVRSSGVAELLTVFCWVTRLATGDVGDSGSIGVVDAVGIGAPVIGDTTVGGCSSINRCLNIISASILLFFSNWE